MENRFTAVSLALVLAIASLSPLRADVIDASATGFTVKTTADIAAPPAKVYDAVVTRVGSWWAASHTWSGTPQNISIEGRAAGCFCEKLDSGGSVQHMAVLLAEPGETLRMSGGLGPLQEIPGILGGRPRITGIR
jgi:uncharacterized protein YndB with AHSA1/START domain